jgi:hypothetical protein
MLGASYCADREVAVMIATLIPRSQPATAALC